MASLVLGAVGTAIGGSIGGSILGISAAAIGGAVGSAAGSFVDAWIVQGLQPNQRVQGARLDSLKVTASTEGAVIPRVFGRMRVGGNIIWATDFREEATTQRQGGKGGGGGVSSTTFAYFASFAVALCEGEIAGIGRVWADGDPLDMTDVTMRVYNGDDLQEPDPFIASLTPAAPAYRGTAYLVFEDLALERFGNRLPQINVEVFKTLAADDTLEGSLRAITMIPGTGEYVYATDMVTRNLGGGVSESENEYADSVDTDFLVSVQRLAAAAPNLESVSLVVSWFGTDLRAGSCQIKPGVEQADKSTSLPWKVNGVERASAHVVSQVDGGPAFAGTPSDFAVTQAIRYLKGLGYRVTFYPFILMDVPPENTLPDPYSDNAAGVGQAVYPWRGRITCSPAAGFAGSVDKTATAGTQIDAFFGSAVASDFSVAATGAGLDLQEPVVSWTGGADWGLRRMVLHYAHLCEAAGGVDAFLIGSELRGVTQVRSGSGTYPASGQLITLAAEVRSIVGASTKISYAADWSEYFGHQPADGSGDVYFHLDNVWANANIDFVGIDNYMPLADWRDGFEHLDAQSWRTTYEQGYLRGNVEGGEGFDWFYASVADRAAQVRTPITDELFEQPWVFRYKALHDWWSRPHYDRPGGAIEGIVPNGHKPALWPTNDSGATASAEPGTFLGVFNGAVRVTDATGNFLSRKASGSVPIVAGETYDFRLFYKAGTAIEHRLTLDIRNLDGVFWSYVGGAAGALRVTLPGVHLFSSVENIDHGGGVYEARFQMTPTESDPTANFGFGPGSNVVGLDVVLISLVVTRVSAGGTAWVPESKPIWFTEFGCPAIDRGANQPNVFVDPKSSESFIPYFSRGWRDDAMQRAYLEAVIGHWSEPGNNPESAVYSGPMIDLDECAVWTWDARPYPFFPGLTQVWSDAENWRLGHWLTGRLGSASLPALVREICTRGGLPAGDIEVSGLRGSIEGMAITSLESPRASLDALMRFFAFDATESQGRIVFVMRGGSSAATIDVNDMVASSGAADAFEIERAQETELPQALKWQVVRADENYDSAQVEARRITVDSSRIALSSFEFAVAPELAERECRRALQEAWVGREGLGFSLPPSRLALDPTDVLSLSHDGRLYQMRLTEVSDGEGRNITAAIQDREAYDQPPGSPRRVLIPRSTVFGASVVEFMDIPRLTDVHVEHQPIVAAYASPWPGVMFIQSVIEGTFRVPGGEGENTVEELTRQHGTFDTFAQMGVTVSDFPSGPLYRWDDGNELVVDIFTGTLTSKSELAVFSGDNAFAIETSEGVWEIFQAANAELIEFGRYRLRRFLRGQRGTEGAMVANVPAGARIVRLDQTLAQAIISVSDLGTERTWYVGPRAAQFIDEGTYSEVFTPTGVGLRPFSPVHVQQPFRTARTPGDLTISWIRRSRDLSADSWDVAEVPLAEGSESYAIEIMSGATVLRTLTSTTTSVVYPSAAQIADFGAELGPGDFLDVRIAQLSETFGAGAVEAVRLNF